MNIVKILGSLVFARVPEVITEYDAVARSVVPKVVTKPWFQSRGMVSSIALVALGLYGVVTGGSIDFTDVQTIGDNLESIIVILGGVGAAVGRSGVVKQ